MAYPTFPLGYEAVEASFRAQLERMVKVANDQEYEHYKATLAAWVDDDAKDVAAGRPRVPPPLPPLLMALDWSVPGLVVTDQRAADLTPKPPAPTGVIAEVGVYSGRDAQGREMYSVGPHDTAEDGTVAEKDGKKFLKVHYVIFGGSDRKVSYYARTA